LDFATIEYTPNPDYVGEETTTDAEPDSFTYVVKDAHSTSNTGTVTIFVITNKSPENVNIAADLNPLQVNTATTATVTFDDPNISDTHTVVLDWGDGTSDTVTLTDGSRSISFSHAYTLPDVYTLTATVTDAAGETASGTFSFVTVFDPTGGFVTGGGWINSPAGAFTADSTLTGKANFGFVSKYQKGKFVPSGQTQFSFKAGDLKFHSTSYEFLVIADAKAIYKGTGTINGAGSFGFTLFAIDAEVNTSDSHLKDKFRIKITGADGVVYDNQPGANLDEDPSTEIAGGSIVIHSGKKK